MNVDFSGKWTAQLEMDPLLPGIEFGTLVVTIDHIEPLLQLAVIASAPHYSLGHFVCNYRTDGTEIVASIHGIRFRTNARWDNAELAVQTTIAMGSFSKGLRSRWALSKDGTVLTIRHLEGESETHVTVLQRQVPSLGEHI